MSDGKLAAIVARFGGRCGICDAPIVPHEDAIVEVDGEWVHVECAEREGYQVVG